MQNPTHTPRGVRGVCAETCRSGPYNSGTRASGISAAPARFKPWPHGPFRTACARATTALRAAVPPPPGHGPLLACCIGAAAGRAHSRSCIVVPRPRRTTTHLCSAAASFGTAQLSSRCAEAPFATQSVANARPLRTGHDSLFMRMQRCGPNDVAHATNASYVRHAAATLIHNRTLLTPHHPTYGARSLQPPPDAGLWRDSLRPTRGRSLLERAPLCPLFDFSVPVSPFTVATSVGARQLLHAAACK